MQDTYGAQLKKELERAIKQVMFVVAAGAIASYSIRQQNDYHIGLFAKKALFVVPTLAGI